MNVKLPDLILSSPSVRTEETLNIVLGEWMLGAESQKYTKVRLRFKSASEEQHEKLSEKLVENNVKIQYSDALYSLSDEGYLHHLVAVLRDSSQFNKGNEPRRVLIVGHNPAMEDLLNYLSTRRLKLANASLDTSYRHFAPGQFYEICFPGLKSWVDFEQTTTKGIVSLLLPLRKRAMLRQQKRERTTAFQAEVDRDNGCSRIS
jgi:phosphohistidine phosphatase SixA